MSRYYTRACNFYYGSKSKILVKQNKSIPLNGRNEISFDKVEIISRRFVKKISIVTLSKLGVEKIGNPAITLSEFEELFAHTQSIKSRMRRN